MSNNFAVKHWMDQDRSAKAEEQTAVAQPAAQEPVAAAVPAAPQAVSAPAHPKPANPTMTVPNPHVAYQGLSVREQFGSGEKVWKNAFALAENVRFTRTPENELQRLRAKLIEEFGAEEEVQPSAPVQKEVAAAPVSPTTRERLADAAFAEAFGKELAEQGGAGIARNLEQAMSAYGAARRGDKT